MDKQARIDAALEAVHSIKAEFNQQSAEVGIAFGVYERLSEAFNSDREITVNGDSILIADSLPIHVSEIKSGAELAEMLRESASTMKRLEVTAGELNAMMKDESAT